MLFFSSMDQAAGLCPYIGFAGICIALGFSAEDQPRPQVA